MKLKTLPLAVVLLTGLTGCFPEGTGQREKIGTVGGAVLGGFLGSKVGEGDGQKIAIGAGTLLGAYVGRDIGRLLDEVDRQKAYQTAQTSLETSPTGQTMTWQNPDTGNAGNFTPVRTYQGNNRPCREFTHEVFIGGQAETVVGQACRTPDGTWQVVS
ncbi:MAG: RT0821/Lpp0805 family surface protein [Pseudomonadota bacterium]